MHLQGNIDVVERKSRGVGADGARGVDEGAFEAIAALGRQGLEFRGEGPILIELDVGAETEVEPMGTRGAFDPRHAGEVEPRIEGEVEVLRGGLVAEDEHQQRGLPMRLLREAAQHQGQYVWGCSLHGADRHGSYGQGARKKRMFRKWERSGPSTLPERPGRALVRTVACALRPGPGCEIVLHPEPDDVVEGQVVIGDGIA